MVTPELTPNLSALAESGGMAPEGGVTPLPSSTYPGFGCLLTGHQPAKHRLLATATAPGAIPGWAGEAVVASRTLLDACAEAGVRSAAIQGDHFLHAVLRTQVADTIWPRVPLDPAIPLDAHGCPL